MYSLRYTQSAALTIGAEGAVFESGKLSVQGYVKDLTSRSVNIGVFVLWIPELP